MLVGCTSKEEMLQQRVQSMAASAELGTVEYTVKKIVKCDDKQTFAIGDRKTLFRSTAYLKAGVDLSGFTADNVQIDGKNVTVTLPHAKLLSFNMPAEETSTVFENYGFSEAISHLKRGIISCDSVRKISVMTCPIWVFSMTPSRM